MWTEKQKRRDKRWGEGSFKIMIHLFTDLVAGAHRRRGSDEEGHGWQAKNKIKNERFNIS